MKILCPCGRTVETGTAPAGSVVQASCCGRRLRVPAETNAGRNPAQASRRVRCVCGVQLVVGSDQAKQVRCGACGQILTIGGPSEAIPLQPTSFDLIQQLPAATPFRSAAPNRASPSARHRQPKKQAPTRPIPHLGFMRGDWVTVWHLVAAAVVVSILGFGIGLAGFVKARIERAKATSSLAWETTTGTIIDSGYRTETRRRTGRGAGFRGPLVVATPWAKYSYEVDGTRMRGGNLRPTPLETNVSEAEKVIAKYPKGLACEVHYNPSNPVESVLEPGVVDRRYQNDIIAYLILGSTLVFLLDCLAGIYNFTYARPFYN